MHGARAKVSIYDPTTGQAKVVGIWNSFDYRVDYDVQPSFILGRFSAAELTTTGVEPVVINAQGWRVVDHGPFVEGRLTNIKDLLTQEYLVLTVIDRQTQQAIATIRGCLPTGMSSGVSAKALQESRNTYLGLLMDDESTVNAEAPDAADLP
jgi:hypothetical protein